MTQSSRNRISRRMVLKGLGGVALSLPFLEAFSPRSARGQSGVDPYVIFMRQASGVAQKSNGGGPAGNGTVGAEPERFYPTDYGALTDATMNGRAVDVLSAYKDKLLILHNVNGGNFDYGDGHANAAFQSLTAAGPTPAGEGQGTDSEANGESIDNRIGRELNPGGRDSLYFYTGSPGGWLGGACISYRAPGNRRSPYMNPKNAFDAIVGTGGSAPGDAAQMLRQQKQQSVNDLVRDEMQTLLANPKLSKSDQTRLDLHFSSIREIEVALGCMLSASDEAALDGAESMTGSSNGDDVLALLKLQMNVAAMAVACGYTRSVAMQISDGTNGGNRFMIDGVLQENYHFISHRQLSHSSDGDIIPGADVIHHKHDRMFGETFRHLLDKLDAYDLGSGTLLDAGMAIWYNDQGQGKAHDVKNIPWIIAGSAGGFLKQGQFMALDGGDKDSKTHCRLLNSIGSVVGLRDGSGNYIADHGDSSLPKGFLNELEA